jgi:hypothetical protein
MLVPGGRFGLTYYLRNRDDRIYSAITLDPSRAETLTAERIWIVSVDDASYEDTPVLKPLLRDYATSEEYGFERIDVLLLQHDG